jgi:uncharacterized protein YkwD
VRRLRSLRLVALSSALIAVLFVAEAAAAVAEGYLVDQENAMVSLVNQHRSADGLNTLRTDSALQTVARRQADRMAAAGYIYHNPNLAAEAGAAVPSWLRIGENVGVGPSTDAVEDAFLASPHHRENIEGDYTMIGLGAVGGSGGVLYFTQNFAKSGAAAPAPSSPAASPAAGSPAPARAPSSPPAAPVPAPSTQTPAARSATTVRATPSTTTTVTIPPTTTTTITAAMAAALEEASTPVSDVVLIPIDDSPGSTTPLHRSSRVTMWRTLRATFDHALAKLTP